MTIEETLSTNWRLATVHFRKIFMGNEVGISCDVCDGLWFRKDLKNIKQSHLLVLEPVYGDSLRSFMICASCQGNLNKQKMPPLSKSHRFAYPIKPDHLPNLNPISIRLISHGLLFMAIRHLRQYGNYKILGQIINVPVDVITWLRNYLGSWMMNTL